MSKHKFEKKSVIFLTGFMGSGKSTVGKLLAEQMSLDFIDFDSFIEQEQGKTITEMFDSGGEDKFRELEHEYLKKLLLKKNVVISLGGGTPCFHNNIELINNSRRILLTTQRRPDGDPAEGGATAPP